MQTEIVCLDTELLGMPVEVEVTFEYQKELSEGGVVYVDEEYFFKQVLVDGHECNWIKDNIFFHEQIINMLEEQE